MGTVTRPVGPLPPRVYWVRRIALLVVLALVVVLATVVVRAVTDSDAAAGDQPGAHSTVDAADDTDAPTSSADDEAADDEAADDEAADAEAEAEADEPAEPVVAESAASEGAATPECTKADIALALRSDATTYRAGADPVFTLDVTNAGDQPCLVDVTADSRELLVVSGPARVWSSADCVDPDARLLLLGPGQVDSQEITWTRVRSNEDCSLEGVEAKPGTYRATVSLLGRSTDELVFVLG